MNTVTIQDATKNWLRDFSLVPGSLFEKLTSTDESLLVYDSPTLTLLASPEVECSHCGERRESAEVAHEVGITCESCTHNEWQSARPEHAFPCGWGTLFAPNDPVDREWFLNNAQEVAHLGIYVFQSDDFDVLLGIDAGGFDFHGAYWMPLYRLRGLKWHDAEDTEGHAGGAAEEEPELIHTYSREDALEDGVLVDVSKLAKDAGFRVPVAITKAVNEALTPAPQDPESGQSWTGRVSDLLTVLRVTAKSQPAKASDVHFTILVAGSSSRRQLRLKASISPDDDGARALTVMLRDES